MINLLSCPCGETPSKLYLSSQGGKRASASGDCCGQWEIAFITRQRYEIDTDDCMALAAVAWNEAPREGKGMKKLHEYVAGLIDKHGSFTKTFKATGVSKGCLHRLFKGKTLNPSDQVLKKLGLRREIRYYTI